MPFRREFEKKVLTLPAILKVTNGVNGYHRILLDSRYHLAKGGGLSTAKINRNKVLRPFTGQQYILNRFQINKKGLTSTIEVSPFLLIYFVRTI